MTYSFKRLKTALLLAASAAVLIPAGQAIALSDTDKSAVEKLIHSYIMDNPSVVVDALEKHRVLAARAEEEKRAETIAQQRDALTSKDLPSIGNPKASITVVEFFDYNCGYCKRALPDLVKLVEQDDDVRVVFHELPILSADSRNAAMWALAAQKQDKYFEFHSALMKHRGAKNENTLTRIAKDLDLDVERLRKDAKSTKVAQQLQNTMEVSRKIGVTGTPAFLVNDDFYGGYIGHDGLERALEKARATN